jgi:hypothetical protein
MKPIMTFGLTGQFRLMMTHKVQATVAPSPTLTCERLPVVREAASLLPDMAEASVAD